MAACAAGRAFADAPDKPLLFTGLRLFDGATARLQDDRSVLVEDGKIAAVLIGNDRPTEGVQIIDCGGRTLMPGLIDAHWHSMLCAMSMMELMTADLGLVTLTAAHEAERTLMRGFTSIRDLAGPAFSLKRAIDAGLTPGPRIWPSGAMISQTGGHGDFRMPYEVPSAPGAPLSRGEILGAGAIADGPEQVLKRSREQLMLGASQLKLAAGGGVASTYDPIDVAQYTQAEFRAAVDCADNWGTYVTVHAYTPRAMQTAMRGGVRCIDHGQMLDEETARMIAGEGVWFSSQAFVGGPYANRYPEGSANQAKQRVMFAGTDAAFELAKKHRLKTAWGTDMLFDPAMTKNQGAVLAQMTRWYSSDEVLLMATSRNAELLAMSGERNPYPGKVGIIQAGAHADLLVVDGDPLTDISLVADPEANLRIIMKGGRIYKNSLEAA
ncbi:metal-dependent hydrolase family protein [Brevundimonas sp.]|uniref:metal-dependent hydrolase family protein n=1 Tax=Brevundimonas sp. TaxID=1871086 RepID=UPI002ED9D3B3